MPTHVPTCLVVDDEPAMRMLLVMMLKEVGGVILEAGTAEEALTLVTREPVDMAVVDRQLRAPIGGVEVLRASRPPAGGGPVARYLMSAHIDEKVRAEAEAVDAIPLDKVELDLAVQRWSAIVSERSSGLPHAR